MKTEHGTYTLHRIERGLTGGWNYELRQGDKAITGSEPITYTGAICRAFYGEFIPNDSQEAVLREQIGKTYDVFLVDGLVRSINGVLFL